MVGCRWGSSRPTPTFPSCSLRTKIFARPKKHSPQNKNFFLSLRTCSHGTKNFARMGWPLPWEQKISPGWVDHSPGDRSGSDPKNFCSQRTTREGSPKIFVRSEQLGRLGKKFLSAANKSENLGVGWGGPRSPTPLTPAKKICNFFFIFFFVRFPETGVDEGYF